MGATYFRNFIFGVEDSLVSTVGLLSGIAIAGVAREAILLTGVVLIFVEAFSMAAGSFLSEASAEEFASKSRSSHSRSILAGTIMFASYFFAGFIPLFPYTIFEGEVALMYSVGFSVAALLVLGILSGILSRVSIWKSAVRMTIVGGVAIAIGVSVGSYFGL